MQDHYDYWKAGNITSRAKKLRKNFLTEIKNYKRKYTIYMLVCNITGDTYYGSTYTTLKERLRRHKSRRNCSSKIIINRGNYLPLIPLETNLSYAKKIEREDYYITNNVCVNKMGAKFNVEKEKETLKKYYANWRKNNKEYRMQYNYWRNSHPIGILARSYFD